MSLIKTLQVAALALIVGLPLPGGPPNRLAIAAAANLQFALPELMTAFIQHHPGVEVTTAFGSSGTIYAQLQNGAPFDLFLSADLTYPDQLVASGLAVPEDRFTYAYGRLVLWAPKGSPIPVERLGLEALRLPEVRRIAIANPRLAPYGLAARETLAKAGLLAAVEPRLVFGENIAQTAQFVQAGAADLGFVALSLTLAPAMAGGRSWLVPEGQHAPLAQAGVILRRAAHPAEARAFRAFLASPEGAALLRRHGFQAETR